MRVARCEVVFKGAEYGGDSVIHADGMDVVLIPMLEGYSTTRQVQNGIRTGK